MSVVTALLLIAVLDLLILHFYGVPWWCSLLQAVAVLALLSPSTRRWAGVSPAGQ